MVRNRQKGEKKVSECEIILVSNSGQKLLNLDILGDATAWTQVTLALRAILRYGRLKL